MNPVIQLCQLALYRPSKLLLLFFLETLELLCYVKLEFYGYPAGETEGNVFVGIGAAITSGLADYTYGTSRFNPALG